MSLKKAMIMLPTQSIGAYKVANPKSKLVIKSLQILTGIQEHT